MPVLLKVHVESTSAHSRTLGAKLTVPLRMETWREPSLMVWQTGSQQPLGLCYTAWTGKLRHRKEGIDHGEPLPAVELV